MRNLALVLLLLAACDEIVASGEPGGSEAEVIDLGTADVSTANGATFTGETKILVPNDVVGASIVVELPEEAADLVTVTRFSRDGRQLRPLRVDPVETLCTLPYPSHPEIQVEQGEHTITIVANASFPDVHLTGIFKKGGSETAGVLDVNLHFAGVEGVNAASAASDPHITTMLAETKRLLAKAHVTVGNVEFHDVTDAALFSVEGPSSAPGTELARLFQTSDATPGRAVNVFLVRRLSQANGSALLGISGGVPGPGEITGTVHWGVAVNGENLADPVEPGDRGRGAALVGQTAAHEILHYLGLFHTSERQFEGDATDHDVLVDTPACLSSADANNDRQLSASECSSADGSNLMFWSGVEYDQLPAGTDAKVTGDQAFVVLHNPLVK